MSLARAFLIPFVALFAALVPVSASQSAPARPSAAAASAGVETLMAEAARVYADEATSDDKKVSAFADLLKDAFAMDFMAAYAIRGRERDFTDDQRTAYRAVFPDYFAASFARQFGDIADRPFAVSETREFGDRDLAVVSVIERDGASDVDIVWRTRLFDGEVKIVDVSANGSSVLLARRRDIGAVLKARGADGLLAALKEQS
ncbi:MAG: ABC transporter substrate-binding protein [Pseudomonadota bacterium]